MGPPATLALRRGDAERRVELPRAPAQGGRSVGVMRADCVLDGRLLPKPCGARPESVELPWALQVRVVGRATLLFREDCGRTLLEALFELNEPVFRAPNCELGEGGRLAESCDSRLPFVAGNRVLVGPRPRLPVLKLLARFEAEPEEFMVRAGRCDAAAAGAERATTLRFWTLCDGVATRPCMLDALI